MRRLNSARKRTTAQHAIALPNTTLWGTRPALEKLAVTSVGKYTLNVNLSYLCFWQACFIVDSVFSPNDAILSCSYRHRCQCHIIMIMNELLVNCLYHTSLRAVDNTSYDSLFFLKHRQHCYLGLIGRWFLKHIMGSQNWIKCTPIDKYSIIVTLNALFLINVTNFELVSCCMLQYIIAEINDRWQ